MIGDEQAEKMEEITVFPAMARAGAKILIIHSHYYLKWSLLRCILLLCQGNACLFHSIHNQPLPVIILMVVRPTPQNIREERDIQMGMFLRAGSYILSIRYQIR